MTGIARVSLAAFVFALLAAAAGAGLAAAPTAPQPGAATVAPRADVILGGIVMWTFKVGAGGKTPMQRANACIARSVDILSDPAVSEKDIRIMVPKKNAEPQIWVGKYLFVTATRADAEANKMPMARLAQKWSKKLWEGLNIARVHRPEEKW